MSTIYIYPGVRQDENGFNYFEGKEEDGRFVKVPAPNDRVYITPGPYSDRLFAQRPGEEQYEIKG